MVLDPISPPYITKATALGAEDGTATVDLVDVIGTARGALTDEGAPRPIDLLYVITTVTPTYPDGTVGFALTGLAPWRRYDLHIRDDSGARLRVPIAVGNDATNASLSVDGEATAEPEDTASITGQARFTPISDGFVIDGAVPAAGCGFSFRLDREARWYSYFPGLSVRGLAILLTSNAGKYEPRLTRSELSAGPHTVRVRDAYGNEAELTVDLTAPPAIFGAWAPVPYFLQPTENDAVTALTTLRAVGLDGAPNSDIQDLRARARSAADFARFDVAGFLQGLFPRSKPFSSDDWNGADLLRPFTFNQTGIPADDGPTMAVLDSAYNKTELQVWARADSPQGPQRLLSPFWLLLPAWPGYAQPYAYITGEMPEVSVVAAERTAGGPFTWTGIDLVDLEATALLLPCPARPVDMVFLGRCGGHGRYIFDGRHGYGVEVGDGATYADADNVERWAARGRMADTVTVYSDIPDVRLADALAELRTSPVVWANRGTVEAADWQRVIIEPESFAIRRAGDKRLSISFTFRYAQALPVQGA